MPDRFRKAARFGLLGVPLLTASVAFAQPANDTCADAAALSSGDALPGTTVGAANDLPLSCVQDDADVFYMFTAPATAPYRFAVTGDSNPGLTLGIITGCDFPFAETACVVGDGSGASASVLLYEGEVAIIRVGSLGAGQDFTVTAGPAPAPPNDECAGAIPLSIGAIFTGDNLAATTTLELADGALCSSISPGLGGGADVFFSVTPTTTGFYTFSTCGSEIDTVVSVHAGCPATPGNAIACNDNGPIGVCGDPFVLYPAVLEGVPLTAGTTYFVRVAGVRSHDPFTGELFDPGRGRIELSVWQGDAAPAPANDTCEDAEDLSWSMGAVGSTAHATGGEPGPCGVDDVWDVWYTFTAGQTVRTVYTFTLTPGSFNNSATMTAYDGCGGAVLACGQYNPFTNPDMNLSVVLDPGQSVRVRVAGQGATQDGDFLIYVEESAPGAPNAYCDAAAPLAVGQSVIADTTGAATAPASGCGSADIAPLWYRFTASAAGFYRFATDFPHDPDSFGRTTLTLYPACGGEPLVCLNSGDAASANPSAAAGAVSLDAGETVFVRASYEAPRRGEMTVSVSGPLPPPPPVNNDACAGATVVASVPFEVTQDITLATPDQDVCISQGAAPLPTPGGVWFRYTPDRERVLRAAVTASGTNVSAKYSIFTGECGSLTQIGCPDDGFPGDSGVRLTPGVTYFILASLSPGFDGTVGEIPYGASLHVRIDAVAPPANDDCATAANLTAGETLINTLAADADAPAPSCAGLDGVLNNAVWYAITPRTAGTLTVTGEGSNPDEWLYSPAGVLYAGACDALTEIACDDPLEGRLLTRSFTLSAQLQAGETYRLAVGSWTQAIGGETRLSVEYTGELGCPADINADGAVDASDITAFLAAWFDDRSGGTLNADFNGSGVVDASDITAFLSAWFADRAGGC